MVKKTTRRKNIAKRASSKRPKNNQTKKRHLKKKGGMFRVLRETPDVIPHAKIPEPDDDNEPAIARIAEIYDTIDLPTAEATNIPVANAKDDASHEQQLEELYNDIRENGWWNFLDAEEFKNLLKKFPEFDVTFKDKYGETMLTKLIGYQRLVPTDKVIKHPTMTIQSLEEALNKMNSYEGRKTKNFDKLKNMVEKRIKELKSSIPSAPPMEDDIVPSAPPMEDDTIPSAPPMEYDRIPSAPTHPIRIPSAPPIEYDRIPSAPTHPIRISSAPPMEDDRIPL